MMPFGLLSAALALTLIASSPSPSPSPSPSSNPIPIAAADPQLEAVLRAIEKVGLKPELQQRGAGLVVTSWKVEETTTLGIGAASETTQTRTRFVVQVGAGGPPLISSESQDSSDRMRWVVRKRMSGDAAKLMAKLRKAVHDEIAAIPKSTPAPEEKPEGAPTP